MVLMGVGAAVGSLLASLQGHPRRSLGLVPLGATGFLIALAWAALSSDVRWPALALGIMGGLVNVPLRAAYQAAVPADARGNGMAVLNTAYYACTTLLAVLLYLLVRDGVLTPAGQLWFLAVLAAIGTAAAWWWLVRESFEQVAEILLAANYRIHTHGPGVGKIPTRGPLLVLANHACWMDPLFLAKVLPRPIFPMMTALFFDLPVLRWLMVHLFHAIRVPAIPFRREAPELQEAIALLDRGEMVVIFPEGMLRRREEVTLRQFGQGIWRILSQRPATPVVVCWIEGNWGSFTSFRHGPPLHNKRIDFWRRIDIVIAEPQPQPLDPALLEDMRATRTYLMRVCLGLRRYLGLEVPDVAEAAFGEPALSEETDG
jgi:1-acyl-sn-glycerol-3-phosphate acyltransferase